MRKPSTRNRLSNPQTERPRRVCSSGAFFVVGTRLDASASPRWCATEWKAGFDVSFYGADGCTGRPARRLRDGGRHASSAPAGGIYDRQAGRSGRALPGRRVRLAVGSQSYSERVIDRGGVRTVQQCRPAHHADARYSRNQRSGSATGCLRSTVEAHDRGLPGIAPWFGWEATRPVSTMPEHSSNSINNLSDFSVGASNVTANRSRDRRGAAAALRGEVIYSINPVPNEDTR